jgi:hypothetical protein
MEEKMPHTRESLQRGYYYHDLLAAVAYKLIAVAEHPETKAVAVVYQPIESVNSGGHENGRPEYLEIEVFLAKLNAPGAYFRPCERLITNPSPHVDSPEVSRAKRMVQERHHELLGISRR